MKHKRRFRAGGFLLSFLLTAAVSPAENKSDRYLYEDTRQLVDLVEEAADQLERKGEAFYTELSEKGSPWLNRSIYFFVYDLDGVCRFHPIEQSLVGKNLSGLRDTYGKPVIQEITKIGTRPEPDAGDWVFYLWEEGTQLTPSWKSSYIRKATLPDGRVMVIGSGLYDIKMEQIFVKDRVARAVEDIKTRGSAAAFRDFRSPASPYVFLDACVFVLNDTGQTLVDPSYPNAVGRNLLNFQDANGMRTIQEVLEKLTKADEAWAQYLWPRPGETLPSRKLVYACKVTESNTTMIVGCDFFVPTPIWMK